MPTRNSTTLVHDTKKPPVVTTSNPGTITQLRSQGYRVVAAEEAPTTGYDALKVDQLKDEVDRRNAAREDTETHVVVDGRTKADYVAALEADDAAGDQGDDQ